MAVQGNDLGFEAELFKLHTTAVALGCEPVNLRHLQTHRRQYLEDEQLRAKQHHGQDIGPIKIAASIAICRNTSFISKKLEEKSRHILVKHPLLDEVFEKRSLRGIVVLSEQRGAQITAPAKRPEGRKIEDFCNSRQDR